VNESICLSKETVGSRTPLFNYKSSELRRTKRKDIFS
jgi:hypothetical protein